MPELRRFRAGGDLVRAARVAAAAVLLPSLAACFDGDPSGPGKDETLELVALAGSGQFAEPESPLPEPFEVLVRRTSDGQVRSDRTVVWEIVEGSGGSLSSGTTVTDGQGRASTTLTLGPDVGLYRVRASVEGGGGGAQPAVFRARAVRPPELTAVPEDPVSPGDTVILEGRNFIPEVEDLVVLFAGLRGRALQATGTSIEAVVPPCLSEGAADVEVALGSFRSDAIPVDVEGLGPALDLAVGEAVRVTDPVGLSCVRLPSDPDARYLALAQSASPEGVASYRYTLVTRIGNGGSGGIFPATAAPSRPAPSAGVGDPFHVRPGEERIRALERRRTIEVSAPRPATAAATAAAVPAVGDRRDFSVLGPGNEFVSITAEVRRVSEEAVIYVDLETPEGGFEPGDLEEMAGLFDDPIHPTITEVFGEASDLDANERVIVLFTPVVNRHTERGADGFVGGFFFGVDLLPDREGSNAGEIFYALVPDPEGEFGDPRSRDQVMRNVPAILAHEFQHMVHFNQRVLELGGTTTDALWLSEALATSAEDVVADVFDARGDSERSWSFRSGNYVRADRFLESPGGVSLVVTQGGGSLEERGAGWLFLKHLRGRTGGDAILGDLTRTTRTGVANVAGVTGLPWHEMIESWTGALYLDGVGAPVEERFEYVDFELRNEISRVDGDYPLNPLELGAEDRTVTDALRASAAAHYLLSPTEPGGASVNLAGTGGGALPAGSMAAITYVRVQ